MFSITKTSSTNTITVTTSFAFDKHQLTLIPSPDATSGTFTLYSKNGDKYVEFKGTTILWDELRPIPIEGKFEGFKLTSLDYDGSSLTLEYIGE